MICSSPGCSNDFNPDLSYRYGVGFSHYKKNSDGEYVRSYSQVFNTQHCCSVVCAKYVTLSRVEQHANIPFGTYTPSIHNPTGEQHHSVCRGNVEYNQDGIMLDSSLPLSCYMCSEDLDGKDIYIPHVDKSHEGRSLNPTVGGVLGCCTLDHAQQLARKLLEEN